MSDLDWKIKPVKAGEYQRLYKNVMLNLEGSWEIFVVFLSLF